MTNLIEKSLIIGFGIFTLIIFLSIIIPFIQKIEDINESESESNDFLLFIEKVDNSINYVILHPDKIREDNLQVPDNINITINQNYIRYDYFENDENVNKILDYPVQFHSRSFIVPGSGIYLINIRYKGCCIEINFTI